MRLPPVGHYCFKPTIWVGRRLRAGNGDNVPGEHRATWVVLLRNPGNPYAEIRSTNTLLLRRLLRSCGRPMDDPIVTRRLRPSFGNDSAPVVLAVDAERVKLVILANALVYEGVPCKRIPRYRVDVLGGECVQSLRMRAMGPPIEFQGNRERGPVKGDVGLGSRVSKAFDLRRELSANTPSRILLPSPPFPFANRTIGSFDQVKHLIPVTLGPNPKLSALQRVHHPVHLPVQWIGVI